MYPFRLHHPRGIDAAIALAAQGGTSIAGGSDLMQLLKDNVETPDKLVDLEGLPLTGIRAVATDLQLGSMARMSDVAAHPEVRRRFPVISEALLASASAQVRNMGAMGGNLLQCTRCGYFRDTVFACNRRVSGSRCPAIQRENRMLAILGGRKHGIATHASDLAVALTALDATLEPRGANNRRRAVKLRDFHRLLGETSQIKTVLSPGELIDAIVVQDMPTIAAGAIAGFDLDEAGAMPGASEIITPDNALKLSPHGGEPQTMKAPLLQDRIVNHNGQHLAVVVADTLDRALDAAARVRVHYHMTKAATDMTAMMDRAFAPRHFRNGTRPPDSHRGDAESACATGTAKVDATYVTPVQDHNPMEPHATIARWDSDRLTVWTSTQGISGAQQTLVTLFGLDKRQVHVACPFVGGGFGCKRSTWPPTTLAAMAAKIVHRPVNLELTRSQMFTSNGHRPRTLQRLRFAADAAGTLVSMRHDGFSQMAQPALGEFSEPVALATELLYACPNVADPHRIIPMNAGRPTFMRAPGESSGNFALESAIDELAAASRMDPLEFRLCNYCEINPQGGKHFASKLLRQRYQTGAEMLGWSRRHREPRSMRRSGTRRTVSYGAEQSATRLA